MTQSDLDSLNVLRQRVDQQVTNRFPRLLHHLGLPQLSIQQVLCLLELHQSIQSQLQPPLPLGRVGAELVPPEYNVVGFFAQDSPHVLGTLLRADVWRLWKEQVLKTRLVWHKSVYPYSMWLIIFKKYLWKKSSPELSNKINKYLIKVVSAYLGMNQMPLIQ